MFLKRYPFGVCKQYHQEKCQFLRRTEKRTQASDRRALPGIFAQGRLTDGAAPPRELGHLEEVRELPDSGAVLWGVQAPSCRGIVLPRELCIPNLCRRLACRERDLRVEFAQWGFLINRDRSEGAFQESFQDPDIPLHGGLEVSPGVS